MTLLGFSLKEVEVFFLVFTRTLGIVATAPILGADLVHHTVKIGLSMFIAILLLPVIPIETVVIPSGVAHLALGILGELAVGIVIGFIARATMVAIEVGAQVVGYQMGFAIVNVFDPQTNTQMSVIALFQNMLAVLIFLSINAHHWLLEALAQSFRSIQPMAVVVPKTVGLMGVNVLQEIFTAAMKIAAPGVVIMLLISLLMGVIARTVPQINILIVGFPLKIGIGLIVIGASMFYFCDEVIRLLGRMRENLAAAMVLLGG